MKANIEKSLGDRHQRKNLDWLWLTFLISVFIFPLFPALGVAGFLLVIFKSGQRNFSKIFASRLNRLLAIISLLFILSAAFAYQPREAWLGLANFLPFFLLFVTLRSLIKDLTHLKQLSWILILPSSPIVILGLGQLYFGWHSAPIVKTILGWNLVAGGEPAGRMSAVFIYTNFLAIYLAIAFSLALGLWLDTWQNWHSKSTRKHTLTLLWLTLIIIADLSGLILTSSRNAWGLAIISFMAYAIYMGWRWLVYGVYSAATAILWASFAPQLGGTQLRAIVPAFFWSRLSDQAYDRPIETLRITQWQFCLNLIKERPWFGWGLRNFTPLYEAKMNFWFGHPHNLFLMLGAETGIISVLLFIILIASIFLKAVKLMLNWSFEGSKLIFFSYLVAFSCCVLFNLLDVTIFDLRINNIGWILLSAISGVVIEKTKSAIG